MISKAATKFFLSRLVRRNRTNTRRRSTQYSEQKYPILASQPIPYKWAWDTGHHLAELMTFVLIDLSRGYQQLVVGDAIP